MMYGSRKRIEDGDLLFVVAGGQRGASVDLDDLPLTIGTHPDCDVLLLASEVGDAELTLKSAPDGLIEVSVTGEDISVAGHKLKEGATRLIGRQDSVILGDAELVIASSLREVDGVQKRRERRTVSLGWAASIAVVVAATGAVALTTNGGMDQIGPSGMAASAPKVDSNSIMPVLASAALEQRLAENHLTLLAVSADRDEDLVVVEGGLRPSQKQSWDEVQKWFDATYGTNVQLEARLTDEDEAVTLPFSVQSIWMVPYPRLTLHDGSQSRVGDILPGGWRLDAIKASDVEISRNGEILTLSL